MDNLIEQYWDRKREYERQLKVDPKDLYAKGQLAEVYFAIEKSQAEQKRLREWAENYPLHVCQVDTDSGRVILHRDILKQIGGGEDV